MAGRVPWGSPRIAAGPWRGPWRGMPSSGANRLIVGQNRLDRGPSAGTHAQQTTERPICHAMSPPGSSRRHDRGSSASNSAANDPRSWKRRGEGWVQTRTNTDDFAVRQGSFHVLTHGDGQPPCADPPSADPPCADPLCAEPPSADPPPSDPPWADPLWADPLCADPPSADRLRQTRPAPTRPPPNRPGRPARPSVFGQLSCSRPPGCDKGRRSGRPGP